jgi:tetratricopeptide (TPR) repeat protein
MKYYILTFLLAASAACNNAAKPVQSTDNTPVSRTNTERSETAIAHSLEKQTPPASSDAPGGKSKWTQGGDAIDTKEYDNAIAAAEAALKAKPGDNSAKKTLSSAYLDRADALTKARQYASALGDYRRALKNDPANESAKQWIEQITQIYDSINREAPKEGEEPPPLQFKK